MCENPLKYLLTTYYARFDWNSNIITHGLIPFDRPFSRKTKEIETYEKYNHIRYKPFRYWIFTQQWISDQMIAIDYTFDLDVNTNCIWKFAQKKSHEILYTVVWGKNMPKKLNEIDSLVNSRLDYRLFILQTSMRLS